MNNGVKNTLETLSQILFLTFFAILVILVSLGIRQDFSAIKTAEFWTEVLVRLTITIVLFNVIYHIDMRNKTHDTDSRFYRAYATNRLRVKVIEDEDRYKDLDEAVESERQDLLEQKCDVLLHRYCTRLSYSKIINDKSIEELFDEFKVTQKKKKRVKLYKLIEEIRAGEITIKPINPQLFLRDKELVHIPDTSYDYSEFLLGVYRNAEKILWFIVCSVFIATITFSLTTVDFWTTFVSNFTLFLSAVVSAFMSASKDLKRKTAIYEKRNLFIKRRLNISVEYIKEQ